MAHEVESMAFVGNRGLPWHAGATAGLIENLSDLAKADEMIAAAKLGWKVDQMPIVVDGIGAHIPDRVANVRNSDHKVLGIVSARYKVVQNDRVFEFAEDLCGVGGRFETAGSLRNGEIVFTSIELPHDFVVDGDVSKVKTFLLVSNGHDGIHAFKACITPVRVVCTNTLNAAFRNAKDKFSIRHTENISGRINQAREILKLTTSYMDDFKVMANNMAHTTVTIQEGLEMVKKIFPLTEDEKRGGAEMSINAQKVMGNWLESQNIESIRMTKWGLWNAITEFIDHGMAYRGGKTSSVSDAKAESILFDGYASRAKKASLESVMSY